MSNIRPSGPSYIMGYWRPWKEDSMLFDSYLDYSKDLGLANYAAGAIGTYIQEASSEQVDAINDLGEEIGYGKDLLSNQIDEVSSELRFLNRNMDIQVEQQKLGNLLLQNIAELLRVPDSEKERQLSIEMGVKFLVNASKDSDLYDDALEEFHKAEELRKQDYFVLHRLGTIYLYTEKHINPEKALEYFLLAAKYASVESDPKVMRLANVLSENFNSANSEATNSPDNIKHLAANSYEKAAFAAYVLGRFDDAENHQKKALKLNPSPQNRFLLAKYSVRNGNTDEAVKYLDTAMDEKPELIVAVFKELDLANEKVVLDLIKKKNKTVNAEIDNMIQIIIDKTKRKKSVLIDSLHELKSTTYDSKVKTSKELKWYIDEMINPPDTKLDNINVTKDLSNFSFAYLINNPFQFFNIEIGKRLWMAENLSMERFRNGEVIKQAQTEEEWITAGDNEMPAWCWASNDQTERKRFGKLYNWYAVKDSRGLAPNDWLIPSEDEFNNLIKYRSNGESYVSVEINLPSSGARSGDNGTFIGIGYGGYYWSRTVSNKTTKIFDFTAPHNDSGISFNHNRNNGFSVRCIKEKGLEEIRREEDKVIKQLEIDKKLFEEELISIRAKHRIKEIEKAKNGIKEKIDPLSEKGLKYWISILIISYVIFYFSGCLE